MWLGPPKWNARAIRLAAMLPSAPIVRFAVSGGDASSGFAPAAMALQRKWKFVVFRSSPSPMNTPVRRVGREPPVDGSESCRTNRGSRPLLASSSRRGGHLQHEQLLRERFLQFFRRDAEPVDGQLQFVDVEAGRARFVRQCPAVFLRPRRARSTVE